MDTPFEIESLLESESGIKLLLEALEATDNMGVIEEALRDHFYDTKNNQPYDSAVKLIKLDREDELKDVEIFKGTFAALNSLSIYGEPNV